MLDNSASKQYEIAQRHDECFSGDSPTLWGVKLEYDIQTAENWLMAQLFDLTEFSGIKEKPEPESFLRIAQTIIANYPYLKITELMLFFSMFKGGKFGKFYGVIDGITLCSSLADFERYRREQLSRIEKQNKQQLRPSTTAIGYDEWQKIKDTYGNE